MRKFRMDIDAINEDMVTQKRREGKKETNIERERAAKLRISKMKQTQKQDKRPIRKKDKTN